MRYQNIFKRIRHRSNVQRPDDNSGCVHPAGLCLNVNPWRCGAVFIDCRLSLGIVAKRRRPSSRLPIMHQRKRQIHTTKQLITQIIQKKIRLITNFVRLRVCSYTFVDIIFLIILSFFNMGVKMYRNREGR